MFSPTDVDYVNPIDKLEADYQAGTASTVAIAGANYTVRTGGNMAFKYLSAADYQTLLNSHNLPAYYWGRSSATQYLVPYGPDMIIEEATLSDDKFYQRYKSGWVEQRGIVSSPSSAASNIVVFPIAFANKSYHKSVNAIFSSGTITSNFAQIRTQNTTATQLDVWFVSSGGTPAFTWRVEGVAASLPANAPKTYFQIADSGIDNPAQVSAAAIVAKVNATNIDVAAPMVDYVVANQQTNPVSVPSNITNYWYKRWKSGRVEQGGFCPGSVQTVNVVLPLPMSDGNYYFGANAKFSAAVSGSVAIGDVSYWAATATGFTFTLGGGTGMLGKTWRIEGMGATI
jgi:hypothetical protein